MCSIDLDRPHPPREGQPEYGVVVAVVTSATCFPALAHRTCLVRPVQVGGGRVEAVAAGNEYATMVLAGQIDGDPIEESRVRHVLTTHAQPRDTAVWKCR